MKQDMTNHCLRASPLDEALARASKEGKMIDRHIFRAYDIRGDVRTQLTPEAVYAIGQGIAEARFSRGSTLALARDARTHSPLLSARLSEGLRARGVHVVDLGQATTPMLYFALHMSDFDGGIMLTGSHNPINDNGLKICRKTESFLGPDIEAVRARVAEPFKALAASDLGQETQSDISEAYAKAILSRLKPARKLHLVVDAGNGVAGPFAVDILTRMGAIVTPLYCEPDGHFPNHHPDPSEPENLEDCRQKVLELGADLGLAFDGDGDRLGVIASDGQIIAADRLLVLFARDVLEKQAGATIIGDVKCSSFSFEDIRLRGGKAVMAKTGHALIKAKMRETGAAFAGEMSGHFFFEEGWYGFDDAIYAAARLVEIVARLGDIHGILADLPQSFATAEIRIPCPDDLKFDLAQAMIDVYQKRLPTSDLDGARIDFPKGWALIRASNTQAIIVARIEAESQDEARKIAQDLVSEMTTYLKSVDRTIDLSPLSHDI